MVEQTCELRLHIEQTMMFNGKVYRYAFREANFENGRYVFSSGSTSKLIEPIMNEYHPDILEEIKETFLMKISNLKREIQKLEEALKKEIIVREIDL